jgi:predicted RNA-binding protein with PIN domain
MRAWIAENHDDASIYFTKYEELADETIEYLTRKNLVKGGKKHFRKNLTQTDLKNG